MYKSIVLASLLGWYDERYLYGWLTFHDIRPYLAFAVGVSGRLAGGVTI